MQAIDHRSCAWCTGIYDEHAKAPYLLSAPLTTEPTHNAARSSKKLE